MKLWAEDEVGAKSRFWYFLKKYKKVKKANGQVIACNEVRKRLEHDARDDARKLSFFSLPVLSWTHTYASEYRRAPTKRRRRTRVETVEEARDWRPVSVYRVCVACYVRPYFHTDSIRYM